jgi:N-acetylglucosamine-6-sulfatase
VAQEASFVTAHTDLAPTILKIAHAKSGWDGLDGSPIPLNAEAMSKETRQEHVNVEFWGLGIPEGVYMFSLDDGKVGKCLLRILFSSHLEANDYDI